MIRGVHQLPLPHQTFHRPADIGRFFLRQAQALGDHPRLDGLIVRLVDEVDRSRIASSWGEHYSRFFPLNSFRSRFG